MKKAIWIMLAVALTFGIPALAGGECSASKAEAAAQQASHKCEATAQECLNHMTAKFQDRGWVGIELDINEETGTLTVTAVEAASPGMDAGFREGDVLVALNGVKMSDENKERVYKAREQMTVGKTVTYTVARDGGKKDLEVTLARIPDNVLAKWIGRHMLEGHADPDSVQIAQN